MIGINLNNWRINENQLSISLPTFFVSIDVYSLEDATYYLLRAVGDEIGETILNFSTLEDAIKFTEINIFNSRTKAEILEQYETLFHSQERQNQLVKKRRDLLLEMRQTLSRLEDDGK